MQIAVIDDIEVERRKIASLIECAVEEMYLCSCNFAFYNSAEHYLSQNNGEKYDLIILDIFMDYLTGMDLAMKIRETDQNVNIVFSSTSNDFAAESYNVDASYYMQKPVTKEKVVQMLKKIRIAHAEKNRAVTLDDGQKVIVRSISHAEYNNHVMYITCKNGSEIRTRMAFHQFVDLMKPFPIFAICNKGTVVNLNEIDSIDKNMIKMKQGDLVTVSRRKANEVHEKYHDFLFDMARKEMMT